MNYVNNYSIYGFMNNYCDINPDINLSYWKTKNKAKLVICKENIDVNLDQFKEISYMYLDKDPNIKGSYPMNQILSLIDSSLLVENLTRKNNKELFETYRKWKNKIVIKNGFNSSEYDEIIEMIEKWRYSAGMKYHWQERAGVDKAFFKRCKDISNFKDNFIILKFYYNNDLVGYSIMPKYFTINEDGIPEISYMLRKCLTKYNDEYKFRNLTEYIDLITFNNVLKQYNLEKLIINWGCSSGGVEWYKEHKWPLYKKDKKYFYKIKTNKNL